MSACEHENFEARVAVNRLTDIPAFIADLTIKCSGCGEKFRFTGVKAGYSPAQPMCSADETELCIPIRPASADPDFGLGMPGFAIRVR
jgi:hypothetical protein